MLSAMARELVERNGIGETADAVWKALNAEHQKLFPTSHNTIDGPCVELDRADSEEETEPGPSVLVFGQQAAPFGRRGRRVRPPVAEQGSLFSFN